MTTPSDQGHLIDELESRQNDVLNRLAELNARVEGLLNDCLAARDARLNEEEPSKAALAPGYAGDSTPWESTAADSTVVK